MSRRVPSFLFHIPESGKDPFGMEELEQRMRSHHPPKVVDVIDEQTQRRMGRIPSSIALLKYR
jgi:hypothetical protein